MPNSNPFRYMRLMMHFVVVQLWMQIFQHIITAMMFFQIIMIALFGIKKSPGPAILTAPLPFLTIAFLLYNLNLFNRPQVIISNRTAADIDKRQSQVLCAQSDCHLMRQEADVDWRRHLFGVVHN